MNESKELKNEVDCLGDNPDALASRIFLQGSQLMGGIFFIALLSNGKMEVFCRRNYLWSPPDKQAELRAKIKDSKLVAMNVHDSEYEDFWKEMIALWNSKPLTEAPAAGSSVVRE